MAEDRSILKRVNSGQAKPNINGVKDIKNFIDNQLKLWKNNPSWQDEPPVTEVTVPKGALSHLTSIFEVSLPPEAVFKILTDNSGNRVFRNIQEMQDRKVVKSENHGQLMELEQTATWKFLWFSGTLNLRVSADRTTNKVSYKLAREGFMKKFEGNWDIQPVYVDGNKDYQAGRIASHIKLQQEVQPKFVPPGPISSYIRGVMSKQTEGMIQDLQDEGKRFRDSAKGIPHGERGQEELSLK